VLFIQIESLPLLKCPCGNELTRGFLECTWCCSKFRFERDPEPQFAAAAVTDLYRDITTVRQARKVAFHKSERRAADKLLLRGLRNITGHWRKWLNEDDEGYDYRVKLSQEGGLYFLQAKGHCEPWFAGGPHDHPEKLKDDFALTDKQAIELFLGYIQYPDTAVRPKIEHAHFNLLVTAFSLVTPSPGEFLQQVVAEDRDEFWVANELSQVQLPKNVEPVSLIDPMLIRPGVVALKDFMSRFGLEF
jgi:hypothetical protein